MDALIIAWDNGDARAAAAAVATLLAGMHTLIGGGPARAGGMAAHHRARSGVSSGA